MHARAFLVRGLLVGVLAGLSTFVVGFLVAEPHIQAAINVEEARSAAETPAVGQHTHAEDGTVVSRHDQRTWGLLTGTLTMGLTLGGLVALVAAGVAGRIGRMGIGQSTAFVALLGWVSIALVPFLKYPASPPAVGNPDTIGARTGWFFLFLGISLATAVVATVLGQRVYERAGAFPAVVAGVAAYLVVMVAVGELLPTVNELGDFPADTLWYFRRASLIVTGTLWATIGVLLTAAVGRLHAQHLRVTERRELAASL